MDNSQLEKTLEELHAELESTQSVDDETRARLKHLMSDIQTVLDEKGKLSDRRAGSLSKRLGDALLELEVSHPNLALNVERVLDAFNEMGI